MADIELGWEVKGSISPQESVSGLLKVISEKGRAGVGTFWCWDGRVSSSSLKFNSNADNMWTELSVVEDQCLGRGYSTWIHLIV